MVKFFSLSLMVAFLNMAAAPAIFAHQDNETSCPPQASLEKCMEMSKNVFNLAETT